MQIKKGHPNLSLSALLTKCPIEEEKPSRLDSISCLEYNLEIDTQTKYEIEIILFGHHTIGFGLWFLGPVPY